METAFNRYMDHTVARLVELGVDESVALDAVFHTVTDLAEKEVLPPYPDETSPTHEAGAWLVAAADFGLADFMVEAVTE